MILFHFSTVTFLVNSYKEFQPNLQKYLRTFTFNVYLIVPISLSDLPCIVGINYLVFYSLEAQAYAFSQELVAKFLNNATITWPSIFRSTTLQSSLQIVTIFLFLYRLTHYFMNDVFHSLACQTFRHGSMIASNFLFFSF